MPSRRLGFFLFFVLLLQPASAEIPVGPGRVVLGAADSIEVFTYRPPTYTNGPLLIILHGVQRNAEDYRNFAITMAERFGGIVAAPLFDRERFPYNDYQQGGILRDGVVRPRADWTFTRLDRLITELRALTGDPARPFYIVGHSAGGQFVARLAGLVGSLGAERLIAANPGSHLFPVRDAEYGYGFGGLPAELSDDAALQRFLAAPLTLYLGTGDNDPEHRSLDRSPPALAQGASRYDRGMACFRTAQALAQSKGWTFNWRLVTTPGVDHNAAKMFAVPEVADALLGAGQMQR
jgi:poly(3-hydroxybutyrate) depolymerase